MPGTAWTRASSRPAHRSPWWRRHPIAVAVVGLIAILAVGTIVDLLRIKADIESGSSTLSDLSLEGLGDGLTETVDGAAARLVRADAVADSSPFLAPLSVLPFVGGQVDAIRDLADAGAEIGRSTRRAALAIDEDLERAAGEPSARLDLLDTLADELDRIQADVAALEIGAEGWLIPPLREGREELAEEIDSIPERFDEARSHVEALTTLLTGPTRYLVLAANNAEMRGGAGMPLSGGIVTFENGDVTFGEFESIANRHVPGVGDLVPEEYAQTYHNFKMGRSWLQSAVSPNFPTMGPIYAAMSAQFSFGPVDGVLEVDVVALRELLAVIGPVEMDGFTYTEENIEAQLLNENYLLFSAANPDVRAERLEVQGRLASMIFDALKERDVDIAALALRMQDAAEGRHLLAYSADPALQELWETVGATGELDPLGLMVTVQNIAANKLDWYIRPRVTITSRQEASTGAWLVQLTVVVENPEREQHVPAVESQRPEPAYRGGVHRAMVAIYLPKAAYDIYSLDRELTEYGLDPPLQMVGRRAFIAEGETATFDLAFSMPEEEISALVLPSARVHPVAYDVNGIELTDDVTTLVLWVPPTAQQETSRSGAPTVAAFLALGGAAATLVGTRARLRLAAHGPRRVLSEPLRRAPLLGFVLFAAAVAALVVGAVVSAVA